MRTLATLLALLLVTPAMAQETSLLGQGAAAQPGLMNPGDVLTPSVPTAPMDRGSAGSSRIFMQDGKRWMRVTAAEEFRELAQEAYGNPELWYLIYYQNRHQFTGERPSDQAELILYLPPSPRERVREAGGRSALEVWPGDTFSGIAADLYGSSRLWPLIYEANKHQLPDQSDPNRLFPEGVDLGARTTFLIPDPWADQAGNSGQGAVSGTVPGAQGTLAGFPASGLQGSAAGLTPGTGSFSGATVGGVPVGSGAVSGGVPNGAVPTMNDLYGSVDPSRLLPSIGAAGRPSAFPSSWGQAPVYRPPASSPGGPGYFDGPGYSRGPVNGPPAPGPGGATSFDQLRLTGPGQITDREAAVILQAGGFYHQRILNYHRPKASNQYQAALMAFSWGSRYKRPRGPVALDAKLKQALFEDYQLLSQARQKYGAWDTISATTQPQAYDAWVRSASQQLTEVNPAQREQLMRSLMQTESGRTHWKNHEPVVSHAGAVGFGQFLPATAKGLGINHYDPEQNLAGIALYLNNLIKKAKQKGLRGRAAVADGLAAYNGGSNYPSSSRRYASGILGRLPGNGSQVA